MWPWEIDGLLVPPGNANLPFQLTNYILDQVINNRLEGLSLSIKMVWLKPKIHICLQYVEMFTWMDEFMKHILDVMKF